VRGLVAAAALLAVAGAGAAGWTTNLVQLDPGQCGSRLQIGSDRTASRTATPTFLLMGDGRLSSYDVSIDGSSIGRFRSTPDAVVCIATTRPLAGGRHVLTASEVAPRPDAVVAPFAFSVDTVPPGRPSKPAVSVFTDTGVRGDGVTTYRQVNLWGTAAPDVAVQLFIHGITIVGGTTSDAKGRWSATTVSLRNGTYAITAVALDGAGNKSAPSKAMRLTIGRHR
jgi:hypothetical protein